MKKMTAYIYQSTRRPGTYLYLAEKDEFGVLPRETDQALAPYEFSFELELDENRSLRKENAALLMQNLDARGFHIQMPDDVESLLARIANPT
ncbi:MAG: YcgL domain-containing protein [Gammaproteobacteria bacterium]|nr:YcgL domain-containing protein [Gammaproteobacteria bacterium]